MTPIRKEIKMELKHEVLMFIACFILAIAFGFAIDALLVYIVCKIIGVAFAWKWVIILWVAQLIGARIK